jgi:hypothetical protein
MAGILGMEVEVSGGVTTVTPPFVSAAPGRHNRRSARDIAHGANLQGCPQHEHLTD